MAWFADAFWLAASGASEEVVANVAGLTSEALIVLALGSAAWLAVLVSGICEVAFSLESVTTLFRLAGLSGLGGCSRSLAIVLGAADSMDCDLVVVGGAASDDFLCSRLDSHVLRLEGSSVHGSGLASPPASHSWDVCSGTT